MQRLPIESLEERRLLAAVRVAVIGDYSADDQTQPVSDVANLVKGWSPDAVVTVGDNNYPNGAASTIDANIGQWYHQFISPYKGSYGAGSPDDVNHFFPALGNHDWNTGTVKPYTDYFTLPNNERYYTTQVGNVGIFVVDSEANEPDGATANSVQGKWIQAAMAASTAKWKLVFFHEPGYTSGSIGDNTNMQWPFKQWGATAVLAGHDHDYERLSENGLPYFVNGLGGESIVDFGNLQPGSLVRYDGDYGAMRIDASDTSITFQFITRTGIVIDSYTINDTSNGLNIIPQGATWKYLDNGSNQGTTWQALGFDDSAWKSGPAQLGYGDGDEATVVGYGSNANNKYITTYFRRSFSVADPSSIAALSLNLVRDDGAVVYLNGTEIYRNNMPPGTINSTTLASTTVGDVDESAWYSANVNPSLLLPGNNVIAVEIHQSDAASSDISFDFQLSATTGQSMPVVPAAPTSLAATAASTSQINLAWKNNGTSQTSVSVERSTDGVNFLPLVSLAGTATSYSDMNLLAGTLYTYRVRATNSVGNSDYSNLASATTFSTNLAQTWLSDLAWTSATVGYGTIQKDKSIKGNPITLRGTAYAKGIGTHAVSNITYNLNGQYTSFVSDVGVDDEVNDAGVGSVDFTVTGDNQVLFDSGALGTLSAVVHISLNVAGVTQLTLTATNGVANSIDYDHADWAGAYLLGPAPVAPAMPTNLVASATSSTQVKLTWSDATGEKGFKIERSTDSGATFTQISTVASGILTYTDATVSAGLSYSYRVRSTNSAGDSAYSNVAPVTTPALLLPAPWTDADIGTVGAKGSASASNGTFTVLGSGSDIWNVADSFNFVYQSLSGNGTIIARVASLTNTNGSAKAGVMIRESLNANAREASVVLTPTAGVQFIRRTSTGGSSSYTPVSASAPLYVRLVRSGNTFTASRSTNGTTWTTIGSASITMASNVFIGLAVTAHSTTALNTSTFDHVTLSGGVVAQTMQVAQAVQPASLFSTKQVTSGNTSVLT